MSEASSTPSSTFEEQFEQLASEDHDKDYYSLVAERVLRAIYKENGKAADAIRMLILHSHDISGSSVRHLINSRVRTLFSPEQHALAEAAIWRECGDDSRLNAISPLTKEDV